MAPEHVDAVTRRFLFSPRRDFGPKVVQLKPIVKQMQRLLEDRDKIVREEGKLLVVEIYHWIGAALRPQLSSLKPVQVGGGVTSIQATKVGQE